MPFDLASARKSGYTDDEILRHLTARGDFDLEGALSAGWSQSQILDHLASRQTPPPRGFLGETGHLIGEGLKGLASVLPSDTDPNPIPNIAKAAGRFLTAPLASFMSAPGGPGSNPLQPFGYAATTMMGGDPERARQLIQQGEGTSSMGAMFGPALAFGAAGRLGRVALRGEKPRLTGEGGFIGEGGSAPVFHSQLARTVETKMPNRASAEQVRSILTNPQHGVKPDEFAWSGLDDWLEARRGQQVTKQEVAAAARETRLEDMVLGEYGPNAPPDYLRPDNYPGTPKFASYVEPGAEPGSYRELFVTAPDMRHEIEFSGLNLSPAERAHINKFNAESDQPAWSDGHEAYSSVPNPIVRIRFNARTDATGKKVLFIEEMQPPSKDNMAKMPEWARKRWADIGLKRAVRYASENGFDRVAWTKGETQASRYDLSKHIDTLELKQTATDDYSVTGSKEHTGILGYRFNSLDELPDIVGKEVADKLITLHRQSENPYNPVRLQGLDLKIGGEGLARIYDELLPRKAKEISKRFGGDGRVYEINFVRNKSRASSYDVDARGIATLKPEMSAHSIDITPDLRRVSLTRGFPLFAPLVGAGTGAAALLSLPSMNKRRRKDQ